MPLDTSINNVGDYYAAHYLEHQFVKDISEPVKSWRELGTRGVPRRLQALGDTYFKAKAQALDYDRPELRAEASEPELAGWHDSLLCALGYSPAPETLVLTAEKAALPVLCRLNRYGKPWLVAAETSFCLPDAALPSGWSNEDPLEELVPLGAAPDGRPHLAASWGEAVARLLREEDSARWVLLLSGSQVHLFDRSTFAQGRWLAFDLDDAYGRKEAASFEAIAALLSAETLCPDGELATVLHDTLESQSHKFTHGVSAKLQSAVRRAIEEVCNGWVDYRRERKLSYRMLAENEPPLPDGGRQITADQLRHEALVFVYRILFCLYAEARGGELGILPINDDIYRLGYSLEALRDLANSGEMPMQAENGTYYHTHLKKLFQLIHRGFQPAHATGSAEPDEPWLPIKPEQLSLFADGAERPRQLRLDQVGRKVLESDGGPAGGFTVRPLTATLFDPEATPLLDRARLPNIRLQRVIRALSLGTDEKGKSIGRINYAELGIVQLGAVYEGLLSYTGFFAGERLIQVHRSLDKKQPSSALEDEAEDPEASPAEDEEEEGSVDAVPQPARNGTKVIFDDDIPGDVQTWFVPEARASEFAEGEIVVERRSRKPRVYLPGEFILRLTGIDRANSASYYTPEVLTRTLVGEALNERLKDFAPADADRIVELTICEPAMGSAAFINEMCDQLAHTYLRLKQEQTGLVIEPGRYEDEWRRVKHFIATRNVYGVDLNPTAVELGALSLWLGSMHRLLVRKGEGAEPDVYRVGAVPWFGLRLRAGNSLVGARRAVWPSDQLRNGAHFGKYAVAPRTLKPGEARQADEIYHFLVLGEDMIPAYRDKMMKQFWPEECAAGTQWMKKHVKKKWGEDDVAAGKAISASIDALWALYTRDRAASLAATSCTATVWPTPSESDEALRPGPTLERQEEIRRTLEKTSGAFQRLRLIMDTWCAFYFWPIDRSADLPSREAWLAGLKVLCGVEVGTKESRAMLAIRLGVHAELEELFAASQGELPDVEQLSQAMPCLSLGRQVADRQHFHHWELVFSELLGPRVEGLATPRGIDLVAGNPPWIHLSWNDAPLLDEFEPLLGVRGAKAAEYDRARPRLLMEQTIVAAYRRLFEQLQGVTSFLNDELLYPALVGMHTNLYKNFIERSWDLLGDYGVAGLLHPDGVFDDPKGGRFRLEYYHRMLGHYQFKNELILFKDVGHQMRFGINIYGRKKREIQFEAVFNIYNPVTIDLCRNSKRTSMPLPNVKTESGHWEVSGHPHRMITISDEVLNEFAMLFEDDDVPPLQSRLPLIHGQPILSVLQKLSQAPERLSSLKGEYVAAAMFHKSYAQSDGIITRCEQSTYIPLSADELVLSGPHIHVARPWSRTARTRCSTKFDYDDVDLTTVADDYLPGSVYRPGDHNEKKSSFLAAISEWPKPSLPGFWPVNSERQRDVLEELCGEKLRIYRYTGYGAVTARKFAYFEAAEGKIAEAIDWLVSKKENNFQDLRNKFGRVLLVQGTPSDLEVAKLPKPLTSYYRHIHRRQCQPGNVRSLMASIVPPGATHIHPLVSIAFVDEGKCLLFDAACFSIVVDAVIRIGGKADIYESTLRNVPILYDMHKQLVSRALRLVAVSNHYAPLWKRNFTAEMCADSWTSDDNRLVHEHELPWASLPDTWERGCALRSDYARRQALLEIDVLVAQALGLTLDELLTMYRIQFPVMWLYENADEYDTRGHRLPNTVRKVAGGKELRAARERHDGKTSLTVSWSINNGNAAVTKTFYPPFTRVDREDDYRRAWATFEARLGSTPVEE